MPVDEPEIVVAGHVCLDVIPTFPGEVHDHLFEPGTLLEVGEAVLSPGGVVSNVGRALHRLGVATRLIGKVGDDLFGQAILGILRESDEGLASHMIVEAADTTSYTIVLSPPGVDRIFLHAPGTNDTFHPREIDPASMGGAQVFHFGYPPLMERTYADGGRALAELFAAVRRRGSAVSLDTAQIDPSSKSAHVDWRAFLTEVLPEVDVFGPSIGEIRMMLGRTLGEGADDLIEIADTLLDMGAAVVALKLGADGLLLKTAGDSDRLGDASGLALGDEWRGRTMLHPCFLVQPVGTTGAGDCTLAGLLTGMLRGRTPEECVRDASAVGACSVEREDSTSGVPTWDAVQARVDAEWPQSDVGLVLDGWTWSDQDRLWVPPGC